MKALAERLNVSQQAVTAYEKGDLNPINHVKDLGTILDFPTEYFFGDDFEEIPEALISFRSRRSLTATVRDKVIARSKHATNLLSAAFRGRFKLPAVDVPFLPHETPEEAARIVRASWNLGLGPIQNMVHLLEAKGVEVYWLSEPSSCVDAFCYMLGDKPFIFLNTHKEAGERGRFDAAHELGHLVLHRNVKNLDNHHVETQADLFASAFLLPMEQFRAEAPKLPLFSSLFTLKARWGVSLQALIRRSYDLQIYTQFRYESAFKEIGRQGWRSHEPHQMGREQSSVHKQAYERLLEKGLTPRLLSEQVHLGVEDLCELTPLARHYLDRKDVTLKHLRLVDSPSEAPSPDTESSVKRVKLSITG